MFKPYPTRKTMPNRKSRKSDRNKVFQANKMFGKAARKARRLSRREAQNEIA